MLIKYKYVFSTKPYLQSLFLSLNQKGSQEIKQFRQKVR